MTLGRVVEAVISDQTCWLAKACSLPLHLAWPTVTVLALCSRSRGTARCDLLPASYDKTARLLVNVVVFYTSSIACLYRNTTKEAALHVVNGPMEAMKRMNAHAGSASM